MRPGPKVVAASLSALAGAVRDGMGADRVRRTLRRVLAAMDENEDGGAEFTLDRWYSVRTPDGQVSIPAKEVEAEGPLPEGDDLTRVKEIARRLPEYFKSTVLEHDGTKYSEVERPHSLENPNLRPGSVRFEDDGSGAESWGFREKGARGTWDEFGYASREEALQQVLSDYLHYFKGALVEFPH